MCEKGPSPNNRSRRQSIRASTDLYRLLVKAAGQAGHGIFILQDNDAKEGAIAFVNPDFPGLLGYSRNALLGKTIRDIISPKDVPVVAERYMQRQKGKKGVPPCYQIRGLRRDGTEVPLEVSAVAAVIDGKPSTIVFATDNSQRKIAEDMLRESEERYRQLVENVNAVIYSVDKDGVTTYISPIFRMLFGTDPAELIGKRFADFIHPDDLLASMQNFRKVMLGSLHEPWECRMILPGDARVFWVQGHNRPVYRDGAIVGFQGVLVDVTARKQVDALKDQFISLVSHELRTPLTVIMGAVNTALSEAAQLPPQEMRHLLEDAASETDLLSDILENLLVLSRSQADRLHLDLEPLSLDDVVKKTVDRARRHSSVHEFVTNLPKTLPPLRADRIRLERVLHNLVENAVKYSPGGQIRVSAKKEGQDLVVEVRDQGPGISPEDQVRLFKPFERIGKVGREDAEGIGLGLLVCQTLVEAHGGKIWLESSPGKGATFLFTVPIDGRKSKRSN